MHRIAIQEREKIKRTTKQKLAGWHSKGGRGGGGNHLELDSIRQTITEGFNGGLHPAENGQRLREVK